MNSQKFIVICSEKDLAGKNIFKHIHEDFPSLNHYLIEEESIYAENIDKKIPGDFFIFATKHKSREERKTLSIHAPGNWEKAEIGGQDNKICKTSAFFLKHLFITLNQEAKKAKSDYECTLEVTHHGPYVEKPCVFVEIGSNEENWKDAEAGKIIARTIKKAISTFKPSDWIPAILLGGGHYNQAGNEIMLRTNYAIGHICPKHMLQYLDENLINQAVDKTIPKPEIILLEWKGLGNYKKKIIDLLEKMNLKYERVQNILKNPELLFHSKKKFSPHSSA